MKPTRRRLLKFSGAAVAGLALGEILGAELGSRALANHVGYGNEEWAWALVTVDRAREQEAVKLLLDLARNQRFLGGWYIRRINVVEPMGEFSPKNPFSMFVGIKARDKKTLIGAFEKFIKIMHDKKFTHVEGHRVKAQPFSANW